MSRDLTKWPRLLVKGAAVTEEQANEILVRTCVPSYLDVNDKVWAAVVRQIMHFRNSSPPQELWLKDRYDERVAWCKERWTHNDARTRELGILGLSYLYNSQIASSWIGGAHGWCGWDGRIFCNTYNIGKWPSSKDVTEEWQEVAEAFPYLDLTAQLVTNEGGYEDHPGELAGEWRVKDGTVTYVPDPVEQIVPLPTEAEAEEFMQQAVYGIAHMHSWHERGVESDRLFQAVKQVEASMKEKER